MKYLAVLFFAVVVVAWLFCESHYRYKVTVPDGKYSTSYYTDAVVRRGSCVYFVQGGGHDTTEVCGQFTIRGK